MKTLTPQQALSQYLRILSALNALRDKTEDDEALKCLHSAEDYLRQAFAEEYMHFEEIR